MREMDERKKDGGWWWVRGGKGDGRNKDERNRECGKRDEMVGKGDRGMKVFEEGWGNGGKMLMIGIKR